MDRVCSSSRAPRSLNVAAERIKVGRSGDRDRVRCCIRAWTCLRCFDTVRDSVRGNILCVPPDQLVSAPVLGQSPHPGRFQRFGNIKEGRRIPAEVPLLRREHPFVGRTHQARPDQSRHTCTKEGRPLRQLPAELLKALPRRLVHPGIQPPFIPSAARETGQPAQHMPAGPGSRTKLRGALKLADADSPRPFCESMRSRRASVPAAVVTPEPASAVRNIPDLEAGKKNLVLAIATVNKVDSLPPEFLRKGRISRSPTWRSSRGAPF